MRLYLIKRRSDGKFFVSTNGLGEVYFSEKPQMFLKTPDGVAANLRRICSEFYASYEDREFFWEKAWRNFDKQRLADYEIVIMDVDILSMTATPAAEFIQIEAIESVPLTRKERMAAA